MVWWRGGVVVLWRGGVVAWWRGGLVARWRGVAGGVVAWSTSPPWKVTWLPVMSGRAVMPTVSSRPDRMWRSSSSVRFSDVDCLTTAATHSGGPRMGGGGSVACGGLCGGADVPSVVDVVRSLCTPIHLESCLSRVFISAFRDAAGAGAGAGAGACVGAGEGRSSSLRWIIFNASSASRTLQMDMMDLLVFLFVCPWKILVASRCWANRQETVPQR